MTKQEIFQIMVAHARDVLPVLRDHEFQYDDALESLGANSMDRADITMMTMESLSLDIPRIELFGPENMGQLTDLLFEKLQAAR